MASSCAPPLRADVDGQSTTSEIVCDEGQEKEYVAFIKEQAEKEAQLEAEMIEEARKENDRKTRDTAFKDALRTIESIITKAQSYSSRMLEHEGAKFSDSDLRITVQPSLFSGGTLRDYQMQGFRWLVRRAFLGESVIIADEMGLGKTIQVLAYVAWMRAHLTGPTLIICPLSTLGNWMDEVHRFTPSVAAVRYHGPAEMRAELRAKYIPHAAKSRSDVDMPVIVTTYDVAVKDVEHLKYIQWRCLVIDEGHKLKNEKGVVRRMLKEYSRASQHTAGSQVKILLTGTPVQNDMLELWSLCNFIMPSVFSDREQFKKIYSFMGLGTAVGTDYLRTQEQQNAIISKLHTLLERYMLRRTKAEVHLALPPKVEALVYTPLTKEQVKILRAIKAGTINETLGDMGWADVRDPTKAASVSTTNELMNLRKVCCHPYEFAEPTEKAAGAGSRGGAGLGSATTQTDERIITTCGKMIVLDKMLRKLKKDGHKVLIFSQFTTMLDILADYLSFVGEDTLGEYRLLTGATPSLERDQYIREFNSDKDNKIFAFLLSTKAGGLGINLVSADTVIFYDSDWNPKSDEQAQDRAHRIGQVRPVVVYRLVTEGASVERKLVRKAAGKGALARMVLQEGKHLIAEGAGSAHGKRKRASTDSARAPGTSTPSAVDGDADGADDESFLDDETGVSRYGRVDEKWLSYWLRMDGFDGAAASPTAGAGASRTSSGSGIGADVEIGSKASSIMRGVQDSELYAILDRARALQAGTRVAKAVEDALLGDQHGSRGSGSNDGAGAGAGNSSSAVVPSAHSLARGSSPATGAGASSSSGPSGRRASKADHSHAAGSLGGSSSCGSHAPLPPMAASTTLPTTVEEIEAEMDRWEAMAAAAPHTPSKGQGYEFVYHQATRGLLPATVPLVAQGAGASSEESATLAAVRAEISAMAAEEAAAADADVAEEAAKPAKTRRKSKADASPQAAQVARRSSRGAKADA